MSDNGITLDQPVEGVTRIILDRPDVLNALSPKMVIAFNEALDGIAADPACRVVIPARAAASARGRTWPPPRSAIPKARPVGRREAGRPAAVQPIIAKICAPPQPSPWSVTGVAAAGMAICMAADIRIAVANGPLPRCASVRS